MGPVKTFLLLTCRMLLVTGIKNLFRLRPANGPFTETKKILKDQRSNGSRAEDAKRVPAPDVLPSARGGDRRKGGEETEGEEPADYTELVRDLVRGEDEDKGEGAGAEECKGAGAEGGKTSRSSQPVSGDLDTFLDSFLAQQAHRCNLSHGTWHAM
jgi:hypothetical protein